MTHLEDGLKAIAAATTQVDLNAVYAAHVTRLIKNGADREDLRVIATEYERRSHQILNEQMGEQP